MGLIDITRTLSKQMAVWPGDTLFQYDHTMAIVENDMVNVGKLQMSTHTGTHLDAPYHYDQKGMKIDEIPLSYLFGRCIVIEQFNRAKIDVDLLKGIDFGKANKILFKTTENQDGHSYENFPVISPDVAEYLKERKIHLIGTDSPSVDPLTSKTLDAHHSLKRAEIFILEGLDLHHVSPGIYELMAFPLKIKDGDGSPVRAVLKEMN